MAEGSSTSPPRTETGGVRPEMTSESWRKVRQILAEVLQYAGDERLVQLGRICGDDRELRRLVESYLEPDPRIDEFFEQGAKIPVAAHANSELTTAAGDELSESEETRVGGGILVGGRVGPYKVTRLLSKGGMGAVYLAEREGDFQQRVALKVIRRGKVTGETVRWFHNERRILAKLEHPNIARLLDGGTTDDGLPYLIMEYVDGEPVDVFCDRNRLSLGERLELFLRVCRAVHHAHQKLVVHCDLKPGNVLITHDRIPKIVDFGIARLLRPEGSGPPNFYDVATALRAGPMTPDYASPEQLLGFRMSTVSDVYSLGVLLYLLLTGHLPYNIRRRVHMERLIFRERPRLPSAAIHRRAEIRTGGGTDAQATPETVSRARGCTPRALHRRLAGDLDQVVLKAMSRDPDRRYGSAAQLAEDLHRHLEHQPVTARKQTFLYLADRFVRRNRLAALVLSLLFGFAVSTTVLWQRASDERRQAVQASEVLEDLLRLFGPDESQGSTVDKREVLDRAHGKLEELADDPELHAILSGALGHGYQGLGGHRDLALELLRESVEIQRELYPAGHSRLVRRIDDLGELLFGLERYAEAAEQFREALDMEEKLNGGKSVESLQIRNNLASSRVALGEYGDAEGLFRQVLQDKSRLLEEAERRGELAKADHLSESLVVTYNNLAQVLKERSEYPEAIELYREGLERRLDLHEPLDPRVANSLSSLGTALYVQGEQLDEAEDRLRQALEIRRQAHGDAHPKVATSLNNLGLVLLALGEVEEAEDRIRAGLDIRRREGVETQKTAFSERTLAALLLERGRPEEAEPLARRALDTFSKERPPGHWRIADAKSILGDCLAKLGDYEDAEPLLLEGYRGLVESRGEETIYTRLAHQRLRDFYAATGAQVASSAGR